MDYSAHDPDHPGGSDPWASSPKANRTSFGQAPTNDIPSSPLPPQASPYREDSQQYGYMGDEDTQNRPSTASENGENGQQGQVAGGGQGQGQGQSQDAPQPQQGQQQQQAPQHGQQPQRYHGTRPQRQQQHYKLQAKVTGLERNGKKDPILRFDVYVCPHGHSVLAIRLMLISLCRPTYPSFEQPNSAMSVGYTRNS